MLLWSIVAVLLLVTLAAMLFPLFRGRDTLETREAFDANIFKDQLKTIDRELDEGQIEEDDAESARIEISRKLLAAADKAEKTPILTSESRAMSRMTALTLGVLVPLSAIGFYLNVGSPNLPDRPLEARLKSAPAQTKVAEIIARGEEMLARKPNDGRGWQIMASVYLRREMYGKARNAYNNAIRLLGPNAERLTGLADSMVLANGGNVPGEALPILKRAMKADPNHPKPRFWMGLYLEQGSKLKEAETIYTALLQKAANDVPWRPMVEERLNGVRKMRGLPGLKVAGTKSQQPPEIKLGDALKKTGKPLKGPTSEDIRQAGKMSSGDRQAMITQYGCEALLTGLKDNGNDLARAGKAPGECAYVVLGKKPDKRKKQ